MFERRPAVPGLYSIDDDEAPSLHGRRCLDCGYVFFPPHTFGCEVCGALPERTEPMELAGAGVLRSFATVHRHGSSDIETPFTVGEIALDVGPTVRVVLENREQDLVIGDRVRSVLRTRATRPGQGEVVELRFERAPRSETAGGPGAAS